MIKAALLNSEGVFERMDELGDASQLTPLHLPQISECDLPPGKYRWIADASNPYGGAFWSLAWLEHVAATAAAAERQAALAGAIGAERKKPAEARRPRRLVTRAARKG